MSGYSYCLNEQYNKPIKFARKKRVLKKRGHEALNQQRPGREVLRYHHVTSKILSYIVGDILDRVFSTRNLASRSRGLGSGKRSGISLCYRYDYFVPEISALQGLLYLDLCLYEPA